MSDFYRDDPANEVKKTRAKSPYARPDTGEVKPTAGDRSAHAAWKRPGEAVKEDDAYIAPSSGAPRFGAGVEGGVPFSGDGVPAAQMVSKRKSVGKGDSVRFAPVKGISFETGQFKKITVDDQEVIEPVTSHVARHRRASRYQQPEASAPESAPVQEVMQAPVQEAADEPAAAQVRAPRRGFVAPDQPLQLDETIRSAATAAPRRQPLAPRASAGEEASDPSARRAVPGGRYQGARTAIPASGAPARRSEVGQLPSDEPQRPARPRPVAYQDKAGEAASPYQRPPRPARRSDEIEEQAAPQRPRPAKADMRHPRPKPALNAEEYIGEEELYEQPERRSASRRQLPQREQPEYEGEKPPRRPSAYAFEEDEGKPAKRKSGCLMIVIIVLLVLGALLAAILLPSWTDDGIGKLVKPMKESIVGLLGDVKNLVAPEEDPVKSFTVSPSEAAAPAELTFSVQSASSATVKGVRVKDELGEIVASATLDGDQGSVILNKDSSIWTLRCTYEQAYSGTFTLETLKKDGFTWVASDKPQPLPVVHISEPAVVKPPIVSFRCSPAGGVVPADLSFTVETSTEVNALSIQNIYGAEVVSAYLDDPESTAAVAETESGRVWQIPYSLTEAYAGNFTLLYRGSDMGSFESSQQSVAVSFIAAAQPTVAPAATNEPEIEETPEPEIEETLEPEIEETPEPEIEETPEPIITLAPTPSPTPAPVTPAPLPAADQLGDTQVVSEADPAGELAINANVYNADKSVNTFVRTEPVSMLTPEEYSLWSGGVFTFRSGPFRQNAAYGAANIAQNSMEILWKNELGSMKTKSKTVYGMGVNMQPAIIKWYLEAREVMSLKDEKKSQKSLREVIAGSYDGKIYFFDLLDGSATRDPIALSAPVGGSVSVATNGTPLLSVGQSFSYLSGKTVKNEYRLFSLLDQKEVASIEGASKSAYATNTAFSNTSLFDKTTGTMIVGGENGLLYTLDTGEEYDYLSGKLSLSPATQAYRSLAKGQKKAETSVTTSVALYDGLAYFGNTTGILQCVNINSMTPVWAIDLDDTVAATPALDYEEDGNTVALYTGRQISKLGKKGTAAIARVNALTGKIDWQIDVEGVAYNKSYDVGVVASPVVGQGKIDDLVIFNVSNGKEGSVVIALDKKTGAAAWTTKLEKYSYSSPVAVYNEDGDAWLIVGDSAGTLHMLDARTGESVGTLQLEGAIDGSPAVYNDILVVGTSAKAGSYLYGVKLK